MSVRNIHKFKRIETRAPRSNLDTTKGIIEYVGIPTVHEFLEWATSKKERGSASIGPSKAISVEFSETGLDKPMESNPTFKAFLEVVPILDHMPEDEVLDGYIARNTYSGRVRLIRRYYGITARK